MIISLILFLLVIFLKLAANCTILDVESFQVAMRSTDEKLSLPIIETDASDFTFDWFVVATAEPSLENARCRIPDFNAFRVSCNESVENGVVKYLNAMLIVSQMIVGFMTVG